MWKSFISNTCRSKYRRLINLTCTIPKVFNSTSTAPEASSVVDTSCFRTSESNPANHGEEHLGLFYQIPYQTSQILFQHYGLMKIFSEQCKVFQETCILIRKPALEIINYLKHADYNSPLYKFVLYGESGAGKSLTMAHVLHYAKVSGWLLVHVPWVGYWLHRKKEVSNSVTREGFVDLPLDATAWLLHFKSQNAALLKELDVRVKGEYIWSQREITKPGDLLSDIIDLGISRIKYSSECIVAILSEIKALAVEGKFKVFIAIDGYNSFFHSHTRVVTDTKVIMPPSKVSFISSFLDFTKPDWHNCAALLTCDKLAVWGNKESHFPIFQLKKEGFEHLDPFVPISVPLLTRKEIESILMYYIERKWLQNTKGNHELALLSGGNGYTLLKLCAPL